MYMITRDGLLQKDDYVVPPFEILSKIPEWIQIGDGVTFRNLLEFFNNYPDLHHVFSGLGNIGKYVDATFTNTGTEQHLEITYSCSLGWSSTTAKNMKRKEGQDPDSKFFEMEFEYEEKPSVYENTYYELLLFDPASDEGRFAITFTLIEELLDLPVKLGSNEYTVNIEKEYKHHKNQMSGCSLYDLIDAVLDSVDFFGDEETKKNECNRLKDIIEDIDGMDGDNE